MLKKIQVIKGQVLPKSHFELQHKQVLQLLVLVHCLLQSVFGRNKVTIEKSVKKNRTHALMVTTFSVGETIVIIWFQIVITNNAVPTFIKAFFQIIPFTFASRQLLH